MKLGYVLKGRTLAISRSGKVFTSGTVYNGKHVKAIQARFERWASMGWPPTEDDDER